MQKSHLLKLVCNWCPFFRWRAGCALAKVALAQTQDSDVVYRGGGEEPNQTEFKHLRTMGSRRNGGNLEPIQSQSALADVVPKDVFFVTKHLDEKDI